MAVVRINAISVTPDRADDLEARFRDRVGEVEEMSGFLGFELLRPTKGDDRYFVYTRWESEEAFEAWVTSDAFRRGHAGTDRVGQGPPVASHSSLLEFDVVLTAEPAGSVSDAAV